MAWRYEVLDFETYYSKDYTLRKMTPVEYLLDPRFECTGCAVASNDDGSPVWYDSAQFRDYVCDLRSRQAGGEKITIVSHNALFDMCLLTWRYGFVPDLMIDTLGMARASVYAFTGSVSLKNVAQHLGCGVKTETILKAEGMRAQDIKDAGLWDDYAAYARNDAELCRDVFKRLREDYPPEEYLVQDTVLRAAITPRFKLDPDILATHLWAVQQAKEGLLNRAGLDNRDALMSDEKFADVLRTFGVEPPTKWSIKKQKDVYAFAKSDQAMAELEEHPDPNVQALIAARLGLKTTIEETRTQRLLTISRLTWPGKLGDGWMPVPLRYSGAHTHRLSGDWKLNFQNIPKKGPLRRAFRAPDGYTVVAADASQIEARVVAWLAGQEDLLQVFRDQGDPYIDFARVAYNDPSLTKAKNPTERFIGKQAVLGLGFGMGWVKFQGQTRKDSRIFLNQEILLADTEALRLVNTYRRKNARIVQAWRTLEQILPIMARENPGIQFGPCTIEHQAVRLPNGLRLFYRDLRQVPGERGPRWVFTYGRETKDIFGGKFIENIVQALARICTLNAALLQRRDFPKIRLALQVHDELVYVVPNRLVNEFQARLIDNMSTPPDWAAALPLAAEANHGASYGDAK